MILSDRSNEYGKERHYAKELLQEDFGQQFV